MGSWAQAVFPEVAACKLICALYPARAGTPTCPPAACGFLLILAKYWLDNWGPLSVRAQAKQQTEGSVDGDDSAYAGAMRDCGTAADKDGSHSSDSNGGEREIVEQRMHILNAANMA